jgi:uncharacterized membrane protein YdbT with pleckstrin-like domain
MSGILFNKNNITVTQDYIEIDGEQMPRDLLWSVQVDKHNEELRSLAWGIGTAVVGLIMIFFFKWTVIGIIVLILGGGLAFMSGKSISKGEVETVVLLSFAFNKDIRDLTHKHVKFNNSKDALELKMLLKP